MQLTGAKLEAVAMALHEGYLENAGKSGTASKAAAVPWAELDETYRQANRDAAANGAQILAAAGYSVVEGRHGIQELGSEQLEMLARLEHERWMAERLDAGWRHSLSRDNDRKLHPSLVPYDGLSPADQQKDRDGVQTLLTALASAGLAVVPNQIPINEAISTPLVVQPGRDNVPKPRLALRIGLTGHRPERLKQALATLNGKRREKGEPLLSPKQHSDALDGALTSLFQTIEHEVASLRADTAIGEFFSGEEPLLRLVTGAAAGSDRMALNAAASLRGDKRSVASVVATPALASPGRAAEWRIDMILPSRPATFVVESSDDVAVPEAAAEVDPAITLTRYWRETFRLPDTVVSLPPMWSRSGHKPAVTPGGAVGDSPELPLRSQLIAAFGQIDNPPQLPDGDPDQSGQHLKLDHRRAADFQFRQSDLMVAIWDGEPAKGPGGTSDIILRAHEAGMPVVLIDACDPFAPPRLVKSIKYTDLHRKDLIDWLPVRYDVESDAIDAAEAPLRKAVRALLGPPADSTTKGHLHGDKRSERQRLQHFLGETWPASQPPPTYEAFEWLFGGRTEKKVGYRRSFFWPVTTPLASSHGDDSKWNEFIKSNPDEGLQGVHLKQQLFPSFAFADTLAVRYAGLYRSVFIRAYLWAALAVLVALLAFFLTPLIKGKVIHEAVELPLKAMLVALELWIIWRIYRLVDKGRSQHWHNKSVEYRALAESLRHLRFLATFGEFSEAGRMAGSNAWWIWYLRAVARGIGLPQGHLDGEYQSSLLESVNKAEVAEQLDYNRTLSHRAEVTEHGAHALGEKLFKAIFALLGAWLLLFLGALLLAYLRVGYLDVSLAGAGKLVKEHAKTAYWCLDFAKPFVGVIAALLPAIGSALVGIRFTADFDGRAARARATTRQLEDDRKRISRAREAPDFDLTRRTLVGVAETLSEDVASFLALYGRKDLQTPG